MWDLEDIGYACFAVAVSVFLISLTITASAFFIWLFYGLVIHIWNLPIS
jgi:hypothetical protein